MGIIKQFFYTLSCQNMFIFYLSPFVSIQVSDAYVKVLSVIVFFSLNFSFLDIFLFLKNFYSLFKTLPSKLLQKACCWSGCVGS